MNIENDNIIFEIEIDYDIYRKTLLNGIILELDKIFSIFNEENNSILIKLLIINKKIVNEKNKYILNIFSDFIISLKKINNNLLDQKEYLEIILNLINMYSFIDNIEIFLIKLLEEVNNKINFLILFENLKKLFEEIKINNKLFYLLCKLIDKEKIKSIKIYNKNKVLIDDNIKKEMIKYKKEIDKIILNISIILVKDYFVYYNSFEMLQILCNNTIINNKSILLDILNNNNSNFQDIYIYCHEKYNKVYNNEKEKLAKCKYIIKNEKFNDFLNDFLNIEYV